MRALSRRSPAVRSSYLLGTVFLVTLCSLEIESDTFSDWKPKPKSTEDRFVDPRGNGYKYETVNMDDGKCPLDVTGTYPYLVKVFDSNGKTVSRNGVILSHVGVLTTLRGNTIKPDDLVVAQRVFNIKQKLFRTCYQTRKIDRIITHPKFQPDLYDQTYNFGILVLVSQFDATSDFVYPTVPIHKSPYEYSQFLRRVMTVQEDYEGCEIPHLIPRNKIVSYLAYTGEISVRMKDNECVETYCKGSGDPQKCTENRKGSGSYNMICVLPKPTDNEITHPKFDDLLGAPMICNGSCVGLVTWYTPQQEFLTVSTFVKIWPWMMTYKDMLWNRTFNRKDWDSVNIEDHRLFFNAISRQVLNKEVAVDKKRIKFIKRLRSRSHGNCLEYSFMFYSTVVLSTILMFST